MIRVGILLAAAAATVGFVGWQGAQTPDPGVSATRGADALAPTIEHPGLQLSVAARAFLDTGLGAPIPVSLDPTGAEIAPPEIDIAVQLRRDLTAVVTENARRSIWVVDRDKNDARRRISRGGVFRDDWRVHAIGAGAIVLRRSGEERTVPIVGEAPPQVETTVKAGAQEARAARRAQKARAAKSNRGNE